MKLDVKRIVGITLVAGAAIVFIMMTSLVLYSELEPESSPYWWIGASRTGVVQSVEPGRLTIKCEDGVHGFRVDGLTRVVLQGDLRLAQGTLVRVKYKSLRDDNVARGIRVLAGPNPASGPAPTESGSAVGSPAPTASGSAVGSPAPTASGSPAPTASATEK